MLYASAPPAAAAKSSANASPSVPSTPSSAAAAAPSPSQQQQQQQQQARAEALADAAQCIALAAALAPSAPVYARSLALVQPFLPLPRLRAGWLLVPDPLPLGTWSSSSQQQQQQQPPRPFFLPGSVTAVGGTASASFASIFPSARERFVARWCVIDAEALRATSPPSDAPAAPRGWEDEEGGNRQSEGGRGGGGSNGNSSYHSSSSSSSAAAAAHHHHNFHHAPRPMRIPLSDILSATPAADASLPAPAGAGLHLRFASSPCAFSSRRPSSAPSSSAAAAPPAGFFVVSPSHASAEAWADALCVAGHVARRGSSSRPGGGGGGGGGGAALARVLAPAVGTVAVAGSGPLAHRRPSSSGLGAR